VVAFDGKEQSEKMKIEIKNQQEKKRKAHCRSNQLCVQSCHDFLSP